MAMTPMEFVRVWRRVTPFSEYSDRSNTSSWAVRGEKPSSKKIDSCRSKRKNEERDTCANFISSRSISKRRRMDLGFFHTVSNGREGGEKVSSVCSSMFSWWFIHRSFSFSVQKKKMFTANIDHLFIHFFCKGKKEKVFISSNGIFNEQK